MKLQAGLRQFAGRFVTRSCFLGTLASLFLALNAAAETFELTTATIADINKAFDSGALNSEQLVKLSLARTLLVLPGFSFLQNNRWRAGEQILFDQVFENATDGRRVFLLGPPTEVPPAFTKSVFEILLRDGCDLHTRAEGGLNVLHAVLVIEVGRKLHLTVLILQPSVASVFDGECPCD